MCLSPFNREKLSFPKLPHQIFPYISSSKVGPHSIPTFKGGWGIAFLVCAPSVKRSGGVKGGWKWIFSGQRTVSDTFGLALLFSFPLTLRRRYEQVFFGTLSPNPILSSICKMRRQSGWSQRVHPTLLFQNQLIHDHEQQGLIIINLHLCV